MEQNQEVRNGTGAVWQEGMEVVAYLDLLGFKCWVNTDLDGTCRLLKDYHRVLVETLQDSQAARAEYHADRNPRCLEEEQNAIDSFDYLLPFSDSILVASHMPDKFIRQLSSFLVRSYLSKAQAHLGSDPTCGKAIFFGPDLKPFGEEWLYSFPVIFRGGISYGNIEAVKVASIIDRTASKTTLIAGVPVIEAVELEQSKKGPRIFCEQSFLQNLSSESKMFFRHVGGTSLSELLWPAFKYHYPKDPFGAASDFNEMFEPAANLWHKFKTDRKAGPHYFEFMRLIIRSTLHFFGNATTIRQQIEHEIKDLQIEDEKPDLFQ